MDKKQTEIKALKEGGFVIVDDAPCRVDELSISKPGKHGSAKARLVAVGLFDNQKRIIVKPADSRIDIPVIEKKSAQVIAKLSEDRVQVMDPDDYAITEVVIPEGMDIKEGEEILIWKFGANIMVKGKK